MEQTMMAVRLFEHGGPEVLQYVEAPMPEVGPDDILMRVRATAVNSWDLRYRAGNLPQPLPGRPPWPLPFQLGRDAAGEVVAIGENVTKWSPGDRVVQLPHPPCRNCALCARGLENLCVNTAYPGHQVFGGYAEYVVRRQDAVLPIPDSIDFETAAATMWTYTTPLNCARQAPVGPGDTVVVTGASGGMAIACAQLQPGRGARATGFAVGDEVLGAAKTSTCCTSKPRCLLSRHWTSPSPAATDKQTSRISQPAQYLPRR